MISNIQTCKDIFENIIDLIEAINNEDMQMELVDSLRKIRSDLINNINKQLVDVKVTIVNVFANDYAIANTLTIAYDKNKNINKHPNFDGKIIIEQCTQFDNNVYFMLRFPSINLYRRVNNEECLLDIIYECEKP